MATSVSDVAPGVVPIGTVTSMCAAPSVTGTTPSDEPSSWTSSAVFCGEPRLVRSSFDTSKVACDPAGTESGPPLTTVERRAKSGSNGECVWMYAIHASRSIRPESRASVPAATIRKLSPPVVRNEKVPIRYGAVGSIGAPLTVDRRDARSLGQRRIVGVRDVLRQPPRIILNINNNTTFENYVLSERPTEEILDQSRSMNRYDVNLSLMEATLYCRKKIEERVNPQNVPESYRNLIGFVTYLLNNVKIVKFSVPDDTNAFTIFETLNDRGLDLSILDLVKNHFFGRADNSTRQREIQTKWTQMLTYLANVEKDDFLKVYWTSRHGRTQKNQLYNNLKRATQNWSQVMSMMDDFLTAAEQYASLEISDSRTWGEIDSSYREIVSALKIIGAKQSHPILLSALTKFDQHQLERLLRLLETLFVRYQLIGNERTGKLEIACALVAHKIYLEELQTANDCFREIQSVYLNDADFRTAFMSKQEKDNTKIKYIFRKMESQARSTSGLPMPSELIANSTLTVEHILPRNPDPSWQTILNSDPELMDFTYKLGNMCLLTNVNRDLGNAPFNDKLTTFGRSSLILTNELSREAGWNRNSINRRQERLANLAISTWQFNI